MFDSLPPIPEREGTQPPSKAELEGVVEYLRKAIAEYGAGAVEYGLELDEAGVSQVLDALVSQVTGEEWLLPVGGDVREFFLHGLYFELGERRASIKEIRGGKEQGISDAVWLQLIGELRLGMLGA